MRKILLFLLLALISISMFGCFQKNSSNDLMYDNEEIDEISVDVPEGNYLQSKKKRFLKTQRLGLKM